MSFLEVLYIVVPVALAYATPLIIAALGGIFSERSGVVNIALEGIMVIGAATGIITTLTLTEMGLGGLSPWISLLVAMVVGALFSLFLAVPAILWRADQTVLGVAINMLAIGLAIFVVRVLYNKGQTDFIEFRIAKENVPILSDIPVLRMFFINVQYTSFIAIALAFVVWFVIFKTPFGLRLRSVGEHPMAADTMGINVTKMRFMGVMLSGAFGGLAGAVYAVTVTTNFSGTTIVGQGFLAIAAMIFGKWNPLGALGAGLFFGFAQALSIIGSNLPVISNVPQVLLLIAPYALTILALAGVVGRADAPKSVGIPYIKGKR
ncbi:MULTISPECIES: ABC transporter permease [Exiguobacterium]|jgi:simple sugar transport system permease protein|uniref:Branched-chain amino acid ABC transporter permease n=3 Tax=Exiguobacterium chiriqhucha TaxID=1385984 RepID=U1N1K2_9BACL|nr:MULTISPECIES: ABC transporter permease [Exiguobacterium]ERG66550.1 branched-chain amino acid ABC transporter permease [Exiguobacterium chiriqhucha RW-2]TCI73952.1 ABC transporter permease [Exiguobacterium sp. IPCI3]TCI83111.1 ABC transporter permease [Exiguobacterium sp. IPCH1]TCI84165.1 ABC transporter permease [Exiguobacterium sp. IPBC4]